MKAIDSVLRRNAGGSGDQGSAGSGAPDRAALDISAALDRVGGDADLLKELASIFIDDYPRQLKLIEEAIAAADWKTAEREAHGLKGAVANFGAADAMEAARKLEFAAREGRHGELPLYLRQVADQLARVRRELDRFAES
jgi:HPt (histidine-containing phosphotransfer) domain-containing protein